MNYDRNRDELAEKCRESEEKMLAAAEKLGTLRRKTAKTCVNLIKNEGINRIRACKNCFNCKH